MWNDRLNLIVLPGLGRTDFIISSVSLSINHFSWVSHNIMFHS